MSRPGLTILNRYALTASEDAFVAAVARLAARVEADGEPGVLAYRFFVNPGEMTARAVVDYRDAAAWIGHHEIAMAWPEMSALHAVARLEEITFLGELAPEIREWIAGSRLTARIRAGNAFAAGFRRDAPV